VYVCVFVFVYVCVFVCVFVFVCVLFILRCGESTAEIAFEV